MTDYPAQLALILQASGLPEPEREYRFHPTRRWRPDLAYPAQRVGIEVEGGAWIYGRHNRPAGYRGDCEKYNAAATMGWIILRFTPAARRPRRPSCGGRWKLLLDFSA